MNDTNTITTNFGKNLSALLAQLGIGKKLAADEIGISYNTMSNIINGNFSPSKDSVEKIEAFISKKGIDSSLLYKEEKSIRNFRVRISANLSGNEKSALRNTIINIEKLLNIIDDLEYNTPVLIYDYFDLYTCWYNGGLFYSSQRLYEFQ